MHNDGHGTVDSCHSNLHGYNEVVISLSSSKLWTLPHDREDNAEWPSKSTIEQLKDMK
jgi:hypothetical protein